MADTKQQTEHQDELRDLDLRDEQAEDVKGGALGDIKGESQDDGHAAEMEVMSWTWGVKK